MLLTDLLHGNTHHPELMFRHPENEYDWLSSDAAVDEVLLINEYTFTEAGLRAG
ncbi:hypothetical protein [Escherichia coli]|uniref:hypothetical protein n=1 Tax=Escherichia coli TaxID=562 RepID=UPI0013DFA143|nr:hypothetical protein [Escherichia coli]